MTTQKLILMSSLSILGLLLPCSSALSMDRKSRREKTKTAAVVDSKSAQDNKADEHAKKAAQKLALQKVEKAIDEKDLHGVQAYIAAGGNVDASDRFELTLLHRAVRADNLDVARLLLSRGALTHGYWRHDLGDTPLHLAVDKKNLPMISLLLDHQADIEARTAYSYSTPLSKAVENACNSTTNEQHEWLSVIELLLNRGADIEGTSVFKLTPLLKTVCTGEKYNNPDWHFGVHSRLPIIKALLRWGADYETHKTRFDTFLRERQEVNQRKANDLELEAIAALKKHLEEFPAEYQSDATAVCLTHSNIDPNGSTQSEMKSVIEGFIQGPASVDGMMKERIKDLIRNEEDEASLDNLFRGNANRRYLELADEAGYTPLLYAVYLGKTTALSHLIHNNALLNARTKHGQTAQMIADQQFQATGDKIFCDIKTQLEDRARILEEKQLAIMKAEQERLKKEEADSFAQLVQLKQAVSDNNQDAVRDCLNSRTVNKKYADGSLPLTHAAGLGRIAIVTQMLAQGAQLGARDDNYHTALTRAVINGHVDMVALLLPHMALADIKATVGGRTAYDFAKKSATRIAKLLSENSLPEYAQQQKNYEQIMMLLDSYNTAAVSKK